MISKIRDGVHFYEFEIFRDHSDLCHFITTRKGGFSLGNFEAFNLSSKVGDNPNNVEANRNKLAEILCITNGSLHFPDQCHTSNVHEVNENSKAYDLLETDALISNTKNECILVLAADCVPIILFDPNVNAIGIVHSGWKGTVGRIVARTIESMVKKFGSDTKDIKAGIGPSISQKNYEVGDELVKQFEFWFADIPSIFMRNPKTGKIHIDLWEANRQLLLRYGVPNKNIEISGMCTYENPELFFSARRDGIQCGRFATGIMLT